MNCGRKPTEIEEQPQSPPPQFFQSCPGPGNQLNTLSGTMASTIAICLEYLLLDTRPPQKCPCYMGSYKSPVLEWSRGNKGCGGRQPESELLLCLIPWGCTGRSLKPQRLSFFTHKRGMMAPYSHLLCARSWLSWFVGVDCPPLFSAL